MARPKKPVDELKDQRVPIMMSEDELKAIDDWRFEARIGSRGDAIRRLCQIGLKADQQLNSLLKAASDATKNRSKGMALIEKQLDKSLLFSSKLSWVDLTVEINRSAVVDSLKVLNAVTELSDPIFRIRNADTVEQALSEAEKTSEAVKKRLEQLEQLKKGDE